MAASKNIWEMISLATSGILGASDSHFNNLSNSFQTESSKPAHHSPSVVEYSAKEGENMISMVNSRLYEPQICIESGDYITIVYKKKFTSDKEGQYITDVNSTIATFSRHDSFETELPGNRSQFTCRSPIDDSETDDESSDDLYLTAVEDDPKLNMTNRNDQYFNNISLIKTHDEVSEEPLDSTSSSAICGCHEGSHARNKCLNTVKYDISLEDDEPLAINFKEFCADIHPVEIFGNDKETQSKQNRKLETSVNRRNKRFLDLSSKKQSISLNDSFPETIFPPRKKRFTMTSTPARNAKNRLEFQAPKSCTNILEKVKSAELAVEE